ncbi:cytochrome P450 [Streptomyces griseofuscus]|uniref:cytochrome P450 n=1 Tax=Streptomyces TaxID=1883 RepID=UPI0018F06395|nr:cytochrome P450 [Streptomyces sp. CRPSP2-6A1]MBJ7002396.1 cytochrome P450 [Streptomyces sp. CRPSP2-6A1]
MTMDLGNPTLYTTSDRYSRWRSLVAAGEPHWSEPGPTHTGFWSVFSHEACGKALSPSAPMTSEYGMMIGFDREHADLSGGRMLVTAEGERHRKLRRIVSPFLSRVAAGSFGERIEREVTGLLRGARESGQEGDTLDVAKGIGPYIPAATVCEILGVPAADRERLITLTGHAFGGEDSSYDGMTPSMAHTEILSYFYDLITERRRRPGDDLVSALLADPELDDQDVLLNCDNVLIGGNETTRHAIAGTFHALAEAPDTLALLSRDPEAFAPAVEEVLRWTSPALHVLRVTTGEFPVGGRVIPAGSPVVAWLPAANRDPRVFDRPDEFRPQRVPNKHLAFGYGLHHCMGAALARIELDVLLRVLSRETKSISITDEPQWIRGLLVQGYKSVRVALEWN